MHVTIVSQYFWPESFRINDLAAGLVARGHRVSVLTGYPCYPRRDDFAQRRPRYETRDGVEIVRVPIASRGTGRPGLLANYLSYAVTASLLGPARVPRGTDVLLVFQISPVSQVLPALVLGAARGVPVVTWVQDLWPQSVAATGAVRSPAVLAAIEQAVRPMYRWCDRLLVQSEGYREPLTLAGVPDDRIDYLPNWAEQVYRPLSGQPEPEPESEPQQSQSQPEPEPQQSQSQPKPEPEPEPELRQAQAQPRPGSAELPDGFVVMLAGNLGRAQALGTLLDAAHRLRRRGDLHWVVVGDGARRDWLAAEIVRRGLSGCVHLLGRRPVDDMPALFDRADALLVTLVRDPLMAMTVPSRLQSYLACGRPVVGALDGEGARVVRQAGSFAVPAEDDAGLARAVDELRAMSPRRRAECGAAARRYYLDHFDRDTLLDHAEYLLADTVERAAAERAGAVRPTDVPSWQPPLRDSPSPHEPAGHEAVPPAVPVGGTPPAAFRSAAATNEGAA